MSMQTNKAKAEEIVNKYKDHVNPYIGSGMLSNTYDDGAILWQAKQCALIHVDGVIEELNAVLASIRFIYDIENEIEGRITEYKAIREEILNLV